MLSCERRAKRCVNIGKNEEKVRKLLNTAFNSFQDFFFRLFAIRIKCNGDTSSVFQFECIEKTIIRNDPITFVKFTFNRTNITYSDNSFLKNCCPFFSAPLGKITLSVFIINALLFSAKKQAKNMTPNNPPDNIKPIGTPIFLTPATAIIIPISTTAPQIKVAIASNFVAREAYLFILHSPLLFCKMRSTVCGCCRKVSPHIDM